MTDVRLKILPPWSVYVKKLVAMFDGDPEIAFNVDWNGQHPSVTISTGNPDKAAALNAVLPERKEYGNVNLEITIDCPKAVNRAFKTSKELFETLFDKNPAFAYCVAPVEEGYWYVDFCYVVFKNTVVQIFADNLNDPHGVLSTLYQDIAEELFDVKRYFASGIAYCTDIESNVGKPLGEWP